MIRTSVLITLAIIMLAAIQARREAQELVDEVKAML